MCSFAPDLAYIHLVSLAAPFRTAACSNTLNHGLEKIQAARAFDIAPIIALFSNWEKDFLAPSMDRSAEDAFNIVCRLDGNVKLDEPHGTRSKKVATGVLHEPLHRQDFAGQISLRAPKVQRPIRPLSSCGHPAPRETCALVPDSRLVFFAPFATVYARLDDFTLRAMNKCVALDVRTNPTPSLPRMPSG